MAGQQGGAKGVQIGEHKSSGLIRS
jgi:hypothetical protein